MSSLFKFMDLPVEIRRLVYRELLGDTVINVGLRLCHEPSNSPLAQNIPTTLHIEYVRPKDTLPSDDVSFKFLPIAQRRLYGIEHYDALVSPLHGRWSDTPLSTPSSIRKCYNVMRASRATYREAIDVLYSTNTFSFRYAEVLGRFCRSLTPTQQLTLKSIRICDHVISALYLTDGEWVWGWDRVLKSLPYGFFQNLLAFRLHLTASYDQYPSESRDFQMASTTFKYLLETIQWLARVKRLKTRQIPITFDLYQGPGVKSPQEWQYMRECAILPQKKTRRLRDDTLEFIRSGEKLQRDDELEGAAVMAEEGFETESEAEVSLEEETAAGEEEEEEEEGEEEGEEEEAVAYKEVIDLTEGDSDMDIEEAPTSSEVIDLTGADSEVDDNVDRRDDSDWDSSLYEYTSECEEFDSEEEMTDAGGREVSPGEARENWAKMMGYER